MLTRHPKNFKRTALAAVLLLIPLVPAIPNSGRLWQAAHCTVCEVTARAQSLYQTARFIYWVQYQTEHPKK